MTMIKKVFPSVIKGIDEKQNTITAVVSTGGKDRFGDIVEPGGADLKNYRKNPVVLWAHDYEKPPIAKSLWVKRSKEGVLAKMKFANTEFAQEIFALYKDGFMKAFSIGFMSLDDEPIDEKDTGMFSPKRFKKWDMLEFSAVPVPANPDALTMAVKKGIVKNKSLKESLEEGWNEEEDEVKDVDKKEDESEEKGEERSGLWVLDEVGKEITFYDDDGTEIKVNQISITKDGEWILTDIQQPVVNPALDELTAENEELRSQNDKLSHKVLELQYKVYQLNQIVQRAKSEIAVDDIANKVADIANGVIRQAQGKIS